LATTLKYDCDFSDNGDRSLSAAELHVPEAFLKNDLAGPLALFV
jgi:hypothetical protein